MFTKRAVSDKATIRRYSVMASVLLAPIATAAETTVFPGRTWDHKTPASVGLDAAKLAAMSDYIGGRGCVVRGGYMVYTWGDSSRRGDVASACKPWYSHFLFKAIEDGKIASLDDELSRWEPRLNAINAALGHKDRQITWRHVANQTSCYGVRDAPGTAYCYNDWQMALFWDTLFVKVYGATHETVDAKVLHPLLTDVLQCEDSPTFMAFGVKDRPGRLGVSVRDFARFGLLYLHEGNWNGRQLISREHARMAVSQPLPARLPRAGFSAAAMIPDQRTVGSRRIPDNQTRHFGSYSWLWWTNGVDAAGQRHWPDVPVDAYGAFGHGGPRAMVIVPSLDLIVSWNDARIRGQGMENEALKRLVGAADWQRPGGRVKDLGAIGPFAKWAKVEITLRGPRSKGRGEPNPFGLRVDGIFRSPTGKIHAVPGFFDGDGNGSLDGEIWKVRFSADETGRWTFTSRSPHAALDRYSGSFTVTPAPKNAPEFHRFGRLEYRGTPGNRVRYLKFRDGPYWLKAGCDDPENFLGTFENYDTQPERKAAIDYLSRRGINSMYIMTHTLDGDHRDVWPWLGTSPDEIKANAGADARFNIVRLEAWRELFEYMQLRGMVPYLVLEDDSAWTGYDHRRYYRELIARFGYLPALLFNLGEEHNENYSLDEGVRWLDELAAIDPYDHPRGMHNVNEPNDVYVNAPHIHFTAIQTGSPSGRPPDPLSHNGRAQAWIERCRSRGKRVLMVGFDEGRPEQDRRAWWSAYMGGGVWEAHVREPYDQPMSAWEPLWTELGGARAFMESLPFWEMEPSNEVVASGSAFCLAKPGEVYALYLPTGGRVAVRLPADGRYDYAWWKATNGRDGLFQNEGATAGGEQSFMAPGGGDWALRIRRQR